MTPTPEQARTGDGKERILLAALEEFAARGFDGASTTAIARRSGVTQPLIHYHFGSKEGLWRATVNEAFNRLIREFIADIPTPTPGGDARRNFLEVVRNLVRFCGRYPQLPRLLYTELPVPSRRSAWLMDTWVRPMVVQVTAMHGQFARKSRMQDLPAGHVVAAITGAAGTFFALGDFMKNAYGLDPSDPEVIDRHADVLVALLEGGLFQRA